MFAFFDKFYLLLSSGMRETYPNGKFHNKSLFVKRVTDVLWNFVQMWMDISDCLWLLIQ